MAPTIEHVTTTDGYNIACYAIGTGPPLVWMPMLPATHLEAEWEVVEQRRGYEAISQMSQFVRFDSRGFGLSDRHCQEYTPLALSRDLEAVVDYLGLEPFRLMATSFAAPIAITYTARHPERVSHLVLWHGFARGSHASGFGHLSPLAELDWETASETFARMFTRWTHDALARQSAAMLRAGVTADVFTRFLREAATWDVTDLLAHVQVPTLVGHRRDFPYIPSDAASELASGIPGARLMTFEGESFLVGADVFAAMGRFISGESTISDAAPRPPSTTAIILFVDIVESSSLTEQMGDAAFRDRSRALDTRLRGIIRERGGVAIEGKLLGDGVLATFTTAAAALDAALLCGAPATEAGLELHIGLHAGDVIREGNNVFGGAVNIASRISALAVPGEVLVSDIVRGLARTSAGVGCEDRGEHTLRGIEEPLRVYAVRRPTAGEDFLP